MSNIIEEIYNGDKAKNTSLAETTHNKETSVSEKTQYTIDYGDAESFEAALNEGENLEGKVVRFTAGELHTDSKFGYNVWAGEHLNFVSPDNPDIQTDDIVTVKVISVENVLNSWIINYEKIENAVVDENTITAPPVTTTTSPTDTTTAETTTETVTEAPAEKETENTYEHNDYYDIVETSAYSNSIGYTILVHKVLAKQDVSIEATVLAYASDGSVIGKSSDSITLTDGKYNFFRYSFEGDISNASIQYSANAKKDSILTGERNAVEMVQYNQSGDDLYITFEQVSDELSSFAKFKLLFYKEEQIVDTEDGYFNIYAENLNGKGSTDVAKVWVWGKDFDRVEYIFEP